MVAFKRIFSAPLILLYGLIYTSVTLTNAEAEDYECDEDDCDKSGDECVCARGGPPGGLSAEQTPQFIVITADNAITTATDYAVRRVTDSHKNSNGCTIPATWFTEVNFTEVSLVRQLYLDGHEIATKSCCHNSYPTAEEVIGTRTWLSENAGIPEDAINGFRSPYLLHDAKTRSILYKNGFRYDSSITELYGTYGAITSPTAEERLWPYTMDYGIPQHCPTGSTGESFCDEDEEYPGLWEVPMWVAQDENDYPISAMDPWSENESVYDIYKREFDRNYNGNRAPVGIFIHPGWLLTDNNNIKQLNTFFKEVLHYNDTYVVTMNQLLDWMNDPSDAEKFRSDFTNDVQCPDSGYVPVWSKPQLEDEEEEEEKAEEEADEADNEDSREPTSKGEGGYFEDVSPSDYVAMAQSQYEKRMRNRRVVRVLSAIGVGIVVGVGCMAYHRKYGHEQSVLQQHLVDGGDRGQASYKDGEPIS